ncbi:uracil-DNA glycosylase [Candidatus Peregrinibacteria bacterium CG11_big_fil_rev_8_21_14_0_20_46_8]|nr:MAG: uracil-DNA glycosylase [Candidatus Peregrinibacteria bacterium CG11_big_fil_rev_8_21_14_0_20_46_8]
MLVKIDSSWREQLSEQFEKEYFAKLAAFVRGEYMTKSIYPPPDKIFRAFDLCPFDKVKVVILGQDPYHGKGQANGLCFAVGAGVDLPPSLQNIYKEIADDIGVAMKPKGDLENWATQGVLLLNATLTVEAHKAGSHQGKGWEDFTDACVEALSRQKTGLVFILWGRYAQEKGKMIDREKHLVLTSAHPSPFSAYNGFFGCKHFSQTNDYLRKIGKEPINWGN